MDYKIEKAEKSTVKIEIKLNKEEWANAQVKAYNKNKSKFSMPGWRKGKVPMKVIENAYGKGIFFEDAINEVFPDYYGEVLDKETTLDVVARPDLDVKDLSDDGITLVATVAVKPEVELGQYKGVEVEKAPVEVTEAEVEAELNRVREQNSRMLTVDDRAIADGDLANIDYEGFCDGVPFQGGKDTGYDLAIGSHSFIEGFEEVEVSRTL